MIPLSFTANGDPKPQGSKRAFVTRYGKAVLVESAGQRLKDWRATVAHAAHLAMLRQSWTTVDGPVAVDLIFRLRAPKKPRWNVPATRPDIDKLTRAVLDALTTVKVYTDDSLVTGIVASKHYGPTPGVEVTVWPR